MLLSSTPWGPPDTRHEVAPGICFYSTPSHGGYHLSADRFNTFRQFFPDFRLFAGDPWFEEDCDAALVILTFATEFSDQDVFLAEQSIRGCAQYFRDSDRRWQQVSSIITHNETLAGALQRADRFRLDHGEDWQVGSVGTNNQDGWDVDLTRVKDGAKQTKHFPQYPDKQFYSSTELFR